MRRASKRTAVVLTLLLHRIHCLSPPNDGHRQESPGLFTAEVLSVLLTGRNDSFSAAIYGDALDRRRDPAAREACSREERPAGSGIEPSSTGNASDGAGQAGSRAPNGRACGGQQRRQIGGVLNRMAVNKPRNRVLIFRLTQDEYQALQAASSGSRSLSEFARARLLDSLAPSPIGTQLSELSHKVSRIEQMLEKN